ncbi:MAG TPA: hypothetical protein VK688_03585 [Gemmatimonadales bacterium]|jgi:hypothetical protein|nr:hypothetical protein [Gemmatimonadales bacterium]
MTPQANAGIMEPSAEAVQAMRERLRALGFLLTDDAARDLLRTLLGIETARLDRRARDAAAACLQSIQDAAREALAILTQGQPTATAPMAAVGATATKAPPPPSPTPAPKRDRDQPVNLAEMVRKRLDEGGPRHEASVRVAEPPPKPAASPPPAPAPPAAIQSRAPAEPRRPVFKGRRGR